MLQVKLLAAAIVLGIAGVATAFRGGSTDDGNTARPVLNPVVSAWDSREVEGGVRLTTLVQYLENVERVSDGASVRPLHISMDFTYGLVLLQSRTHLRLHTLGDSTPIEMSVAGVSPQLALPQGPTLPVYDYVVTLVPKEGFTWGTIRGVDDLDFYVASTVQ